MKGEDFEVQRKLTIKNAKYDIINKNISTSIINLKIENVTTNKFLLRTNPNLIFLHFIENVINQYYLQDIQKIGHLTVKGQRLGNLFGILEEIKLKNIELNQIEDYQVVEHFFRDIITDKNSITTIILGDMNNLILDISIFNDFHNLENLVITKCDIQQLNFSDLTKLKKLRELSLLNCNLTQIEIDDFLTLPNLKRLVLGENPVLNNKASMTELVIHIGSDINIFLDEIDQNVLEEMLKRIRFLGLDVRLYG